MRVLNSSEQALFEKPPTFNSQQRKEFFDLPADLERLAQDVRTTVNRAGFVLSCGYFRAARRFFSPRDFHDGDIEYVIQQLDAPSDAFQPTVYAERTRQHHEQLIAETLGVARFDAEAEALMAVEIEDMIRAQLKPKLIFWRCIDVLHRLRIQLPGYYRLARVYRVTR